MYGRLSRFCLLLAVHIGDKRYVDEGEVLVSDAELELPHGFDEWRRLDITDSTAQLRRISQ